MITSTVLFLRAHLIAMASYGLLLAVAIGSFYPYPQSLFFCFLSIFALAAFYGYYDEGRRMWRSVNRGNLEKYGSVVGFCAYPRPGTSLLKALDRYANVQPEDIEEIKMQTCRFSNPYLKDLSKYFADSGMRRNTQIEVMGVGNPDDMQEVRNYFPNLVVAHSRARLVTHFNLVRAKGQYYLWFEPEHDDDASKGSYIPSKGAVFIAVEDEKLAFARYEQDRLPEPVAIVSY